MRGAGYLRRRKAASHIPWVPENRVPIMSPTDGLGGVAAKTFHPTLLPVTAIKPSEVQIPGNWV